MSENIKQHRLMNGPLMKVLQRDKDDHELLILADLVDRPLETVNRSWERFQVNWKFVMIKQPKILIVEPRFI